MKIKYLFVLLVFVSCRQAPERPRPNDWQGKWNAQWKTPPESYPGIENMVFAMNGIFTFSADSLTVQANGFDGCIFNTDTLMHTQSWYILNDTLFLLSDSNIQGMTYRVKSKSEDKIELQLLDDIFITLTK
jgi:hypothetical protein